MINGFPIEESYKLAGDFVVKSIAETISHPSYNTYGVDFEKEIPFLVKKLSKKA